MKKFTATIILFSLAFLSSSLSFGQKAITPGRDVVIPDGSEISAMTTETISSKTAQEDDPITFKVEEDLVIDGVVVIAKGTAIKGIVTNAKKS